MYDNAVIIAGGKSSRMGKDKALLPFGTYNSLAEYQYTRLQKLFSTVYISTKKDKFDFKAALIYDRYEDSSPLVALLSIFDSLDVESIFVLSVDAPFVGKDIIESLLIEDKEDIDAIIARSPSGEQPLCGFYKKSILKMAHVQYKNGNHKLNDLLSLVNTRKVIFNDDRPFANLNYLEDYTSALKVDLTQLSG